MHVLVTASVTIVSFYVLLPESAVVNKRICAQHLLTVYNFTRVLIKQLLDEIFVISRIINVEVKTESNK